MNSIVLYSGSATACWALLQSFKVTLKVDEQWIQLNGLQVQGWQTCGGPQPAAQIETDGTVTFPGDFSGIHDLTLEFTTVTNVQSIRLDVYEKRDPSIILREIIPGFIGISMKIPASEGQKFFVLFSFHFQILHTKVDIFYFNHFLISCLIN